jgi:DNA end-binding protein Ku
MIAIGTVTIRTKERICALRPHGDTVLLTTLLYPDEVIIDLNAKTPEFKLPKQELSMASSLIDLLAQPFNPEQYHDHYRDALAKLIDAKLEGVELEEAKPARRAGEVVDLMAALQASIGKLKSEKPAERVSAAQAIAGEDPVPEETEKSAAGKARKTAKKGKSAGTTSAGRSKKSKSSRGAA